MVDLNKDLIAEVAKKHLGTSEYEAILMSDMANKVYVIKSDNGSVVLRVKILGKLVRYLYNILTN